LAILLTRDETHSAHSSDEGIDILSKMAEQTKHGSIHEDDKSPFTISKTKFL
jgi:hypothetical protein